MPEATTIEAPAGHLSVAASRARMTGRRLEETALAERYRRDPASRTQVVEALLPFAHALAKRFFRYEEPLEDLQQVATIGLIKALDRFDPSKGGSFGAFAIPTINGELRRHYRDHVWSMHVPRASKERALRVARVERELTANGHAPTAAEVASRLGETVEAVVDARLALQAMRATSLDRSTTGDEGESVIARTVGTTDDGFEAAENRAAVQSITSELCERDRRILFLRFNEGLSQSQIGREIGVSQMQVSRVLRRIIAELEPVARRSWT